MLDANNAGPGERRAGGPWVSLALLIVAAHGALLVARSSFVVDGTRYFCLFDDAMISLVYARNWVAGHGLVWNVGEAPVEGYTNFGWVVVLAVIHLLPLSPIGVCLAVQIVGLGLVLLYSWAAAQVGRRLGVPAWGCGAIVLLVGMALRLKFLAVLGMETGVLAVLAVCAFLMTLRSLEGGPVRVLTFVSLSAACLVRTDLVLLLAAFALVLLYRRRDQAARVILYTAAALVPIVLHLVWRHSYYGEWAPNTYYAKVYGWPLADRLQRGLHEAAMSLLRHAPLLLVVVVGFVRRATAPAFLALSAYALCLAYQTWVGGDAWPLDRFLWPALVCLLPLAVAEIAAPDGWIRKRAGRAGAEAKFAAGALLVVILVFVNLGKWGETLLIDLPWGTDANIRNVRWARLIDTMTTPDAVIGVYYAGAMPYFTPRTYVDFLGKCDRHIARLPVQIPWTENHRVMPGHFKWSWPYALGRRKPDLIPENEGRYIHYARDYQEHYIQCRALDDPKEKTTFMVRKDSTRVHWEKMTRSRKWDLHLPAVVDDPTYELLKRLSQ